MDEPSPGSAALADRSAPRRRWLGALRLLLSAAILGVLLWKFDFTEVLSRLGSIELAAVGAAIALLLVGQWLNALRWRWMLRPLVITVPSTPVLFRLVLIGSFFSVLLPTSVGGDVVRAEMSKGFAGGRIPAYTSILACRILGLLATLVIGALALGLASVAYSLGHAYTVAALLCGAALLGVAALTLSDRPTVSRLRRRGLAMLGRLSGELDRVVAALAGQRRMLLRAFALSVLIIAVAMIGTVSVLAVGLGITAPAYMHWLAVPVAMVATLLPVSFNGAGIREVVFVVLYARVGVDPVSATALGLAFTALLTLVGIAGGLVLLASRGAPLRR